MTRENLQQPAQEPGTLSILGRKFLSLVSGRYSLRQVLLRVNRSPLRHVVKAVATLSDLPGKRRRRAYARTVAPVPEVGALRRDGYCRVQPEPALLAELREAANERWQRIGEESRRANKTYLKAFITADLKAGRIGNDSIFVRFATQPAVVDLVAAYFGEAPYLTYVAVDLSEYAGETLSTSQLWHRDYDDTKVVKLFTYLTDVPDTAHGPFTFLPPDLSKKIRATAAAHLADRIVFSRVSPQAVTRMTAPAGTTFLVDTGRCYHMGSRVEAGRERLMFTACYITRPSIYPKYFNTVAVRAPLGERERLLLLP